MKTLLPARVANIRVVMEARGSVANLTEQLLNLRSFVQGTKHWPV